MKKITKAMIFAAGFGKRLIPLTEKIPKPLLQLNGKTLLENCILFYYFLRFLFRRMWFLA